MEIKNKSTIHAIDSMEELEELTKTKLCVADGYFLEIISGNNDANVKMSWPYSKGCHYCTFEELFHHYKVYAFDREDLNGYIKYLST